MRHLALEIVIGERVSLILSFQLICLYFTIFFQLDVRFAIILQLLLLSQLPILLTLLNLCTYQTQTYAYVISQINLLLTLHGASFQ